jgi:hypothetical protein
MGNKLAIFGWRKAFFLDKNTKKFVEHNRKLWNKFNEKAENLNGEILFELNMMHSSAISSSYLANVLSKKYKAKIVGYHLSKPNWRTLYGFFMRSNEKVYESFGMSKIASTKLNKVLQNESDVLYKKVYTSLNTKRDVENISVEDVLIGDLIYDSFLRSMNKPTIDLKDKDFINSLKNSLDIYIFWRNYFDTHNVKAINVSHCIYNLAIPLRIAITKDIPAFQGNAEYIYRVSRKNMFAYAEFLGMREGFGELPEIAKEKALKQAKNRIRLRFKGEVGVDMAYSKKSAYTQNKLKRLIKESPRKKVFIALHCFFDGPHCYGYNLFPDFFEWLDFLGDISKNTDYDWYLKTHADFLPGNISIINLFLKKYPKFNLLPSNSSHHQIIEEGIDIALTTYGTIGFEYAALGVPVINASLNNPHILYNFNLHPKSVKEYSEVLHNLDKINLKIDKNEVYEYYFMSKLHRSNNWLFNNYNHMIEDLGGYSEQFTSKIYGYWVERFTILRHDETIKVLSEFVDSEDFIMSTKFLEKD